MDLSKVKTGLRVKTGNLGSTDGMMIKSFHLTARKSGVYGTILRYVPGHGGDVWFVLHDRTNLIGAYVFDEIEPMTLWERFMVWLKGVIS